jgi:hypothetical protein
MNSSSYFQSQGRTPSSTAHSSFFDVHQHLDDNSHLFDEMIQTTQSASEKMASPNQQPKAKVLFQFFDGWAMTES